MTSQNVIDLARTEMANIDAQISRLRAVRDAWETIITAQKELSIFQPSTETVPPTFRATLHRQEDVMSESSAYGDKTGTLRRFMLAQNGSGVSRADLIAKAKTLTDNTNFAYRFISRMVESGEMAERDGRFFATDKMRQRIAEIAA